MAIKEKKAELLSFIKYKLRGADDLDKQLKSLSRLSYKALREWAIRNDIID